MSNELGFEVVPAGKPTMTAFSNDRTAEFEALVRPLMNWLGKSHPHMTAIITYDCAELVEGVCCINAYTPGEG